MADASPALSPPPDPYRIAVLDRAIDKRNRAGGSALILAGLLGMLFLAIGSVARHTIPDTILVTIWMLLIPALVVVVSLWIVRVIQLRRLRHLDVLPPPLAPADALTRATTRRARAGAAVWILAAAAFVLTMVGFAIHSTSTAALAIYATLWMLSLFGFVTALVLFIIRAFQLTSATRLAAMPPTTPAQTLPPPTQTATAATPPDWYPNPSAPDQLRYWDGTTWTDHVATPETQPHPTAP